MIRLFQGKADQNFISSAPLTGWLLLAVIVEEITVMSPRFLRARLVIASWTPARHHRVVDLNNRWHMDCF